MTGSEWLLIGAGMALSVELYQRIGFGRKAVDYIAAIQRIYQTAIRKGSDHWKERAMLLHGRRLFVISFEMLGMLLIVAFPLLVIMLFWYMFFGDFLSGMFSFLGIVGSIAIVGLYVVARKFLLNV